MKSRKPAPSTRFAACCGQATRAVSQAWKWRTNGLRRVRTAIVAGISWRFATDYNLVARFGTESTDGERSIMHRTLACAVLLAHAHAFIPARHLARQKNTLVASMPDGWRRGLRRAALDTDTTGRETRLDPLRARRCGTLRGTAADDAGGRLRRRRGDAPWERALGYGVITGGRPGAQGGRERREPRAPRRAEARGRGGGARRRREGTGE